MSGLGLPPGMSSVPGDVGDEEKREFCANGNNICDKFVGETCGCAVLTPGQQEEAIRRGICVYAAVGGQIGRMSRDRNGGLFTRVPSLNDNLGAGQERRG